jgi:hypothetical protein
MTMSAFVRYLPAAAELLPWLLNLATWFLARALNMPQPLVHATSLFVFMQAQAFENSFLKALCPKRLKRRLLALSGRAGQKSRSGRELWPLRPRSGPARPSVQASAAALLPHRQRP